MSRCVNIILYLVKSVLIGLIFAAILIASIPSLRQQTTQWIPQNPFERDGVLSYAYAVQHAAPAVVNIYTQTQQQGQSRPQNLGSGVIMNKEGYILTNYHVIAKASQVIVALQDGRILQGQLIGSDIRTDLAVLKITASHLPVIPKEPDFKPQVGDVVLAIGNPFNVGQSVTQGIISATGRGDLTSLGDDSRGRQDFLQTDAAVNEGNSGGALINSKGYLVGISTATLHNRTPNQEGYGISFAIPYSLANTIMAQLIEHGRVIRGWVGLSAVKPSDIMMRLLNISDHRGLLINSVTKDGPADKAGIKEQDLLLAINGESIQSVDQVLQQVAHAKIGAKLALSILRDGKKIEIPITVREDQR